MTDKNIIKVYTTSNGAELNISAPSTKQLISATNNRAQYFAEMAKKYRDEAKSHMDNAKYYAERNSDVTYEYIESVRATLEDLIATKQDLGDYALKEEIPVQVSELENDALYVKETQYNSGISTINNELAKTIKKNQITNCILEIPKRVDYSFADGTITIKAGSVFVFPQGTEDLSADYPIGSTYRNDNLKVAGTSFANGKFFVWAEMQSNIAYSPTISGTDIGMLCYKATNNAFVARRIATQTASGTSTPTSGYWLYYNTSENKIYDIANGSITSERVSLPLLTLKFVDGVCNSIGQTFNGMGFIGNTVWADKGIKGLIPNGRNADGTLKNTEFTTNSVLIYTKNLGGSGNLVLRANSFENYITANYNEELNLNLSSTNTDVQRALVGTWTADSNGFITKFESKFPFRAVDYEDFVRIRSYLIESYMNGKSWYRVWSDGWKEQGGYFTQTSAGTSVTYLKPFSNTNYTLLKNGITNFSSSTTLSKTGWSSTDVNAGNDTKYHGYWFACGY